MPYEVYLKKNEERRLLAGHAWVYANEVARIEGKDKNGSLATVYARFSEDDRSFFTCTIFVPLPGCGNEGKRS